MASTGRTTARPTSVLTICASHFGSFAHLRVPLPICAGTSVAVHPWRYRYVPSRTRVPGACAQVHPQRYIRSGTSAALEFIAFIAQPIAFGAIVVYTSASHCFDSFVPFNHALDKKSAVFLL
jgi:hypothetical protein